MKSTAYELGLSHLRCLVPTEVNKWSFLHTLLAACCTSEVIERPGV